MANKDLTITLRTKNAFSAGFSELGKGVKSVSDKIKGLFDIGAKPVLVISAGIMALKKAFDLAEESVMGLGRKFREMKTESLAKSFEFLAYSISLVSTESKQAVDVFNSQNRVMDEQVKRNRSLEDANINLEKARRLATATTDEERQAIEDEYAQVQINTQAKRQQADIEREVARAKEEASLKAIEANKLQAKSDELAQTALENRTRAAAMGRKVVNATTGVTFLSNKEIESLETAQKAASELANKAVEEQEKIDAQIQKLRLEANENLQVASQGQIAIEAARIDQQASLLDLEAKNNERRAKLQEELNKKIEDLKQKETDILKDSADAQDEIQKRAFEQQKAANEKIAALTVGEFIKQEQEKQEREKEVSSDAKKAARLQQLSSTGAKLSKKDQQFIDMFKKIEAAKEVEKVAQNNLDQIEKKQQLNKLESIRALLEKNQTALDNLLKGG